MTPEDLEAVLCRIDNLRGRVERAEVRWVLPRIDQWREERRRDAVPPEFCPLPDHSRCGADASQLVPLRGTHR